MTKPEPPADRPVPELSLEVQRELNRIITNVSGSKMTWNRMPAKRPRKSGRRK